MGMDKSEMNRLSQPGSANLASHYHKCLSAGMHKDIDVIAWFLIERHLHHSLTFTIAGTSDFTLQRQIFADLSKEKARWKQHGIAQGVNIIKTLLFTELPSVRKAQVITHKLSSWTCSLLSFSSPNSLYFCKLILCLYTENDPAAV